MSLKKKNGQAWGSNWGAVTEWLRAWLPILWSWARISVDWHFKFQDF